MRRRRKRKRRGVLSQNFPRTVDLLACSKGRHPKIFDRKVATHSQLVCNSRKENDTLDALQIISVSITKRPQNPIVVFPLEFPCRTRAFASICA